jgi:neurofibromin 1
MDVGLKHCLTLGYHENPLLRNAFLQLTSSILRTATPFGGLESQVTQSSDPRPFLDALVSDNLAFAVAICEVCPLPEVDEMLALLFRSAEAKGNLLSLVKVMLEKEVAQTSESRYKSNVHVLMCRSRVGAVPRQLNHDEGAHNIRKDVRIVSSIQEE